MDSRVSADPLCAECDRPMTVLKLAAPRAIRHEGDDMLEIPPPVKGAVEFLGKIPNALVSLVCHRNDTARFENQEWLLRGDGDVSWHSYYLVRDCIYSVVEVCK